MSVFEDDDGQAYLAYVWWETGPNREHGIYRMSADYLTLAERVYLWNIPFYMYDGDRWLPTGSSQGDYVWLPMEFNATGVPSMTYHQDWDFKLSTGAYRAFDPARNLALGKTATASSETGANAAASVTAATTYQKYAAIRWESAASDPQWIRVDLGAAMEVDRVILKWHTDYAKAFDIQVSNDAATWTSVFTTTTGASYSVTDVTFAKTRAPYVRMNGTARGTANGYSLFAFMVLDD